MFISQMPDLYAFISHLRCQIYALIKTGIGGEVIY